jgi:prepilin-type processing-associated H-X9-DG protein
VQQVRETARRLSCQNNLKQLGLGLHLYHDQSRQFPPGGLAEWSWQARLLPQLENDALYRRFDFSVEPFEPPNDRRLDVIVPVFVCPSDPRGSDVYTDFTLLRFAHANYPGSRDDGDPSRCGIFPYSTSSRMADVIDGTSQTLMVGERPIVFEGRTFGWWVWGGEATVNAHQGFRRGDPHKQDSVEHWWSHHPGGANFVFVDGSLHYLSYQIDQRTFVALGSRAGREVTGQ